jgi:steroid delta-isomerase-like uncharacterized protein
MQRREILERAAEKVAAWNRGDADAVVADALDDLLWRDIAFPMPLAGPEALKTALLGYRAAFPDLHVEITSQTLNGDRLVQEWTATGTHRGELMGIAPTGRAAKIYGVTVSVFDDDGRLIEGSTYWNPLVMMHQLGVVMPPPSERVATSN